MSNIKYRMEKNEIIATGSYTGLLKDNKFMSILPMRVLLMKVLLVANGKMLQI